METDQDTWLVNGSEDVENRSENIEPPVVKKKFCNTNFAQRMRNRTKEERCKAQESKEPQTSCKSLSVEVMRLSSAHATSRGITPSSPKARKKRRVKSNWNKGIITKQKKKNSKLSMNGDVVTQGEESAKEFIFYPVLGCSRTTPFVGKYNTIKARKDFISKFEETPISGDDDEVSNKDEVKDKQEHENCDISKDNNEEEQNSDLTKEMNTEINSDTTPAKAGQDEKIIIAGPSKLPEMTEASVSSEKSQAQIGLNMTVVSVSPEKLSGKSINTSAKAIESEEPVSQASPHVKKLFDEPEEDLLTRDGTEEVFNQGNKSANTMKNKRTRRKGKRLRQKRALPREEIDQMSGSPTCRRVLPYDKVDCSRTRPFCRPFPKVLSKDDNVSIDCSTSSVLNVTHSPDKSYGEADKSAEETVAGNKRKSELDDQARHEHISLMKKLRSSATPSSPRKPRSPGKKNISLKLPNHKICAFFSTGCNCKDGHHSTALECKKILKRTFEVKDCFIKLTRVEDEEDDLVLRWLESCRRANEVEELKEPEMVDNVPSETMEVVEEPSKELLIPSRKESNDTVQIPDEESKNLNKIESSDESIIDSVSSSRNQKKRRVACLSSSESSSESTAPSVTSSIRQRSARNEASVARKRIFNVYEDEDETDKEVEEFSREVVRRSTRNQNRSVSTYQYLDHLYDSDDDIFGPVPDTMTRSQSVQGSASQTLMKHANGNAHFEEANTSHPLTEANLKKAQLSNSFVKPCLRSSNHSVSSKGDRSKRNRSVSFTFAHQDLTKSLVSVSKEPPKIFHPDVNKEVKVQIMRLESIFNWSLPSKFVAMEIDKLTENYARANFIDMPIKLPEPEVILPLDPEPELQPESELEPEPERVVESEPEPEVLEPMATVSSEEDEGPTVVAEAIGPVKRPIKIVQVQEKAVAKVTNELGDLDLSTVFVCSLCTKVFVSLETLNRHKESTHRTLKEPQESTEHKEPKESREPKKPSKEHTPKQLASAMSSSVKKRRKLTCSDSLMCTVCSLTFPDKVILFDHVITHSQSELQLAYAKLKKERDLDISTKILESRPKKKSVDDRTSITPARVSSDSEQQLSIDEPATIRRISSPPAPVTPKPVQLNNNNSINPNPVTICACHANETWNLTNHDLQIEMVLQCGNCSVIFRRTECFEVHYRTNMVCRKVRSDSESRVTIMLCSSCPFVLRSLPDMRAHLEMHANRKSDGTVTFICNICKVAFFGVGSIFYTHWFNHLKSQTFVASRGSFPKMSVVSVLEDAGVNISTKKADEGFFYIAEHVCRKCKLPFGSENDLVKHQKSSCSTKAIVAPRVDPASTMPAAPRSTAGSVLSLKIVCNLCKRYFSSKSAYDQHVQEKGHLQTPALKYSNVPITSQIHTFVCSLCRTMTKTVLDMKLHWKKVHSPLRDIYACKNCDQKPNGDLNMWTWENFQAHCARIHSNQDVCSIGYFVGVDHICETCKTAFATKKSLGEHLEIHEKTASEPARILQAAVLPKPRLMVSNVVEADGGRQISLALPVENATSVIVANNNATKNVETIETIELDSRSNSPVENQPATVPFMTSLSSDYETLLDSSIKAAIDKVPEEPQVDPKPVEPNLEPFEVVLLNDESAPAATKEKDSVSTSNKPSFLRVKSLAELQKASEDKPQTPVQVINPMISNQQPQQPHRPPQPQSYWYNSCNGLPPPMTPIAPTGGVIKRVSQNHHYPPAQDQRNQPPPPYRPPSAAIQLPERSNPDSGTKRPSGAATRIPQGISYPLAQQPLSQFQQGSPLRTYGMPRALPQQPQPTSNGYSNLYGPSGAAASAKNPQRVLYCCKICNAFRSEIPSLVKQHEKTSHPGLFQRSQQQPQQPQTYQQQQQRHQHMKHVPVSQMPQRSRHAMPNNGGSVVQRVVSNEPHLPFSCRLCQTRFCTNQEVLDHIELVHRAPPPQVCCYVCDYCTTPLIFETEEALRQHMEVAHNHICQICAKVFPNGEELSLHVSTLHPQ